MEESKHARAIFSVQISKERNKQDELAFSFTNNIIIIAVMIIVL